MTITPRVEKPISPHVVRFSQAISVCMRKTFPICCLKWADVEREYIEVVKGDLQRFFVLDFNDQAMNRHFKKYNDPDEARANPRNVLVGRHEDWHFLCDYYMSRAFQVQSRMNKAARSSLTIIAASPSCFYNDSTSSLREKRSRSIVWSCFGKHTFKLDNQMLELQSQPTVEGSQPFSEDEICDQVLGRRPGYSKGLGKKDVERGIFEAGGFVAKNDIRRGILDAVDVIEKHDIERGILDSVLFMHRECLFRLRFFDVEPNAA
ncbi:CACTA en-spm transposon protein [Cucumis melo var. makuwa]|uniref:CACTA en-spm transposon protein n=1 Tax=Cucumis melo var. makuwa TaxID=1194695 RepID=A0A5D3BYB3_CUCMM|nr:CACTA en-spm transposon protein [Cucumis melo var. makuwa]